MFALGYVTDNLRGRIKTYYGSTIREMTPLVAGLKPMQNPMRRLTQPLLSRFIVYGVTVPGTLGHRVLPMGGTLPHRVLSMGGTLPHTVLPMSGTLPHRVLPIGESPTNRTLCNCITTQTLLNDDGRIESIIHLLCNDNFTKPCSHEHSLDHLLTTALSFL